MKKVQDVQEDAPDTNAPPGARILLVDDDPLVLDSLGGFLELEGFDVTGAETIPRATELLEAQTFDLLITDVNMPTSDGIELLRHVKANHEDVAVILITGYGTISSAVQAIRLGAWDYLTKPISDEAVRLTVRRALAQQRLLAENRRLKQALLGRGGFDGIIGADPRMAKIFELIETVADSDATVLITGESGTGKNVIARAIHDHSRRREGPFVVVACGALSESLLESELFGHVRGAFTDAISDSPGKLAAADGGTIFLDEISTASPRLQVKLLRVLQERRFEPVGSNRTAAVDVRVILATNHDLWAQVQAGRFRQDLYYRINVLNIQLPPLRDRAGDIPLLAEHFLQKYLPASRKPIQAFNAEAMDLLQRYDWPGNVRELENCVERAVVLCRGEYITPEDLWPAAVPGARPGPASGPAAKNHLTLKEALAGPERQIILAALRANGGNRQATARQLGINRTTLYKKMKRYDLMDYPQA